MTISLEEHVARAIWKARHSLKPYDVGTAKQRSDVGHEARSAIAAVFEHEGENCPSDAAIMQMCDDIRESERAACEAIAREESEAARPDFNGRVDPCELAANRIAARKGKGEG